ncbi:MAG: hypothetical protein IPJ01_07095 [Micavibrio sp.]|nr:hypothetical protein [Micavibrio sp.]
MMLDKDHIKAEIHQLFPRKQFDESKLDVFASDLINGIMTGWGNMYPPPERQIPAELEKKIEPFIGEEDFHAGLREIQDSFYEINDTEKAIIKRFQKQTEAFRREYSVIKTWLLFEGRIHSPAYYNYDDSNDEFTFPERLEQLEAHLDAVIQVLQIDLNQIAKKKKGRPEDTSISILVRNVFVMGHCLLGQHGSISNNENPFNLILRKCYEVAGYKASECAHYIEPCFKNNLSLYQMAFAYKKYGRLDLYVQHVLKTDHIDYILSFFDHDWNEWEKPHNFQLLTQTKKSA